MADETVEIGAATAGDEAFVRRLSRTVFARFGDYETTLPRAMATPWIRTVVARAGSRPIGFAMYSTEDVALGEIDLMAIAVEPDHHARGVGRLLLAHVESAARALLPPGEAAVRLTVAVDNTSAVRLFERAGFRRVSGADSVYPKGQPSMELRKKV